MGTKPAPLNAVTVTVEAVVAAIWPTDGFPAGQTASVDVTVPTNCAPGIGRFTGGRKQVTINLVNGTTVAVTKGFEVDCDLHTPSNNLEINWGGNQFHMTAFTAAICSKPGLPNPPTAPVNRIDGTGTGRYDGVDGYTVMFTLIDNGEPGAGNDEIALLIYQTSNPSNVILNVTLNFITTGNIQAHVDQKKQVSTGGWLRQTCRAARSFCSRRLARNIPPVSPAAVHPNLDCTPKVRQIEF